jgi:hypothetical protein
MLQIDVDIPAGTPPAPKSASASKKYPKYIQQNDTKNPSIIIIINRSSIDLLQLLLVVVRRKYRQKPAIMKNVSRIASLMGTWTLQTQLHANIGRYEMRSYFSMHLMPDPMRGYGCQMDDDNNDDDANHPVCPEIMNQACVSDPKANQECVSTETEVLNWSDGTYE